MKTNTKVTDKETGTIKRGILRVDLGKEVVEHVEDEVVSEQLLKLCINDKPFTTFICSPTQTKELIIGHLLTQNIIDKPEEIKRLKIQKGNANVKLNQETIHPHSKEKPQKPEPRNFILSPETILEAVTALDIKAALFKRTGGTHAAALLDSSSDVLVFSEDVGRHNAVDKVIGEAALRHIDLKRTFLASTGRLSLDIVMKAAKVGVPVIVSVASPTDKGIEAADRKGLTLIGFTRGRRFNIYSHPERIRTLAGSSTWSGQLRT